MNCQSPRHTAARFPGIALSVAVATIATFTAAQAQAAHTGGKKTGPVVRTCSVGNFSSGCIAGTNTTVGNGVFGRNTSTGAAIEGQADGIGQGLIGYNDGNPGGYGVYARSLYGNALYAYADTGVAVYAASGEGGAASTIPLLVQSYSYPGDLILGEWGTNVIFLADTAGNLTLTGQVYTDGSCRNGCSKSRHERTFGARSSSPTVEDFGEATLHDGAAHVTLDPSFANGIDPAKPYLVFVTPEGDATDLYVFNRTASGFDVRESHGRTAAAFAYRIVAKPYGVKDERMALHDEPHGVVPAHQPVVR